ncbi:MAG: phytoene desaturase family protein [Planctomycetota bacterium]
MADYDVAVIGAGMDGLVAAGLLARRGLKVVVLEARERAGGRCSTLEVHPGFRVSPVLPVAPRVPRELIKALDLGRFGLEERPSEPGVTLLREGKALHIPAARSAAAAAAGSHGDGAGYLRLCEFLDRVVPVLSGLLTQEPLPFSRPGLLEVLGRGGAPWREAARNAWRLRGLGEADLLELLRTAPQSLKDFAEDWLETEAVRALVILPALRGSFAGPYSPGGVTNLLLWEAVNAGRLQRGTVFKGGLGAVGLALLRAAEAAGAVVRTQADVVKLRCEGGRATGVVLAGGEVVPARCVLAAGDVRRALLELIDPLDLGLTLRPRAAEFRAEGCVSLVHFALEGLPPATEGAPYDGLFQLGDRLDDLERAFDDAKYGRMSSAPWIELLFPSALDPSLAPAGKHVATAWVQYTPRHLREGTWSEQREVLGDLVQGRIEARLPGFAGRVLARTVLTPLDLEERYGLPGGHPYGGELALDQLFTNRPLPEFGRYATPIVGLYLCGAGTHPGGHLSGISGRNAAARILREWQQTAPAAG